MNFYSFDFLESDYSWKKDPRWPVFANCPAGCASNFVLGRTLRDEVGPMMLTISRFVVAALFYAVVLGRSAVKKRLPFRHWVLLTAMSLTGVLGFPLLLYRGLQLTTATDAVLINATGPLVTAVLAAILLKERLFPRHILGGLISFFGVALIVSGGSFERLCQWHVNVGDLYILLAVVLWGLYSVISRWATRSHSVFSVTAISTWMALPLPRGRCGWQPAPTNWSCTSCGSCLYRYFPFGGCFPIMERRGAPGRAEPGDGIL
jgi:drug/metabolite transporter (DMT)-like permease